MDMRRGHILILLIVLSLTPMGSGAVNEQGVSLSFQGITLRHVDGATVVEATVQVLSAPEEIEYVSVDLLVDGCLRYGECWSNITGVASSNPAVRAPSNITFSTTFTLDGSHRVSLRCYARNYAGQHAFVESRGFTWTDAPGSGSGGEIQLGRVSAEEGGGSLRVTAGVNMCSSSGVKSTQFTVYVDGEAVYESRRDSLYVDEGWLPIESEAIETYLVPVDERSSEMQLQCRLVAGDGYETLLVSRHTTLAAQRCHLCIGVKGDGRTSPEGELAVVVGSEASVTAYPSLNSTFSHWTLNGEHYSGDQTTVVTVEADANLTAVFTEPLSPSLERVPGVEPGPTPWLEAPEGKVKLTIIAQPPDAKSITLEPPRGVYFADVGAVIRVGCVSRNDNWLFRDWSVGTGSDGVRRFLGIGDYNTVEIELTQDTVVIASHSYNLT